MPFLLDTNVVSETVRPRPEARVLTWLKVQTPAELFLAAQTIGELVRGARKVKDEARRRHFEEWVERDLAEQFEGRVLSFEAAAAVLWGRLMGDGDRTGRPPPAADAQIAAIALHHDLTLVTRNTKDFERLGVKLINPWEDDVGD